MSANRSKVKTSTCLEYVSTQEQKITQTVTFSGSADEVTPSGYNAEQEDWETMWDGLEVEPDFSGR